MIICHKILCLIIKMVKDLFLWYDMPYLNDYYNGTKFCLHGITWHTLMLTAQNVVFVLYDTA